MNTRNDYLSEFEQEFELDNFSSEYDGEAFAEEFEEESENDFSGESNEEFESDNEYELSDEYELNDEYELDGEETETEFENYLQESYTPDQEFEDRLYSALNGEYESSFEMEQEIDRVLHEMEVEYFWKAAKGLWNKHKKKIMGLGKHLIPGGTLAGLAKYAGIDVRNLLKSDLLKKGLSMAANAYLPGVGGAVVGKLLNRETSPADKRAGAGQMVKVARDTYRNMAQLVPNLRAGNIPNQIHGFSRQALSMAKRKHFRAGAKNKRVIPIKPGSVVVVKRSRIIVYS